MESESQCTVARNDPTQSWESQVGPIPTHIHSHTSTYNIHVQTCMDAHSGVATPGPGHQHDSNMLANSIPLVKASITDRSASRLSTRSMHVRSHTMIYCSAQRVKFNI